ncbi:MAG: coiled-coil domain-containing protein [Saprospiraceae bacterium]
MKWKCLFFLCWLISGYAAAQEFILTGRIIDQQSQKGVPNLVVQAIGYSQGRTDSEGIFRIAIPKNLDNIKIEVSNSYKILSHLGGNVPVPRSSNVMVEMLVQKLAGENDQLQKEVDRLKRQNRLKTQQIETLQATIEDSLKIYRKRLATQNKSVNAERDSLIQLVERLTEKLESNFVLANKREAYQNISTDLLTYVTRLKDLRDWLGHVDDVLLNQQAMTNFNKVLEAYSQARDQLFVKQADYQDQLQKYWTDETLATDLQKICDLALKSIHDQHILPLNNTLLQPIGDFYNGKKARLVVKKEITKQADTTTGNLLLPIRNLEQEVNTFNTILSKMK